MNKVISMENRDCFFILLVGFLISCTLTIQKTDLVLLSGQYCNKSTLKPFSGKVVSKFSSGEIEGENTFKNGVITKSKSFGYDGELVGGSVYEQVKDDNILYNYNIYRITFVSSHEGKEYKYYSIKVILKKELEDSNYELLKSKIMQEVEKLGYLDRVRGDDLTFEVLKGELEFPLYETKIN
jgi:hypothetical protein